MLHCYNVTLLHCYTASDTLLYIKLFKHIYNSRWIQRQNCLIFKNVFFHQKEHDGNFEEEEWEQEEEDKVKGGDRINVWGDAPPG